METHLLGVMRRSHSHMFSSLSMDSCDVEEGLLGESGNLPGWGPSVATEEPGAPSKLINLSGS